MHIINKILTIIILSIAPINYSIAYNFSSNVFTFQKKLAHKGNSAAQYQLGTMYESGTGVKADLNEALKWYKKSAAQNNNAAAKIRITYIDILKNGYYNKKHNIWLEKLKIDAKKRNGLSAFLLGSMYKNGMGVKKNLKQSRKYLIIADRAYISGANDELSTVNTLIIKEKKERLELLKIKAASIKKLQEIKNQKIAEKLHEDKLENDKKRQDKINRETVKNNKIIQNKLRIDQLKLKNSLIKKQEKKSKIVKKPAVTWKDAIKQQNNIRKSYKASKPIKDKKDIQPNIIIKKSGISWADAINKKDKTNKHKNNIKPENSTNFPAPSIKKNTGISWGEAVKQKKQ